MRSVGAQLRPGAAEVLLGVPASELADRHTPLGELWGRAAHEVHERLLEAGHPERRLDVFESLLAARLPKCAACILRVRTRSRALRPRPTCARSWKRAGTATVGSSLSSVKQSD